MNYALKIAETQQLLSNHDQADALRIVQAAITVAAIPGLVSREARELALTRLREMASAHPGSSEILHCVIQHIETHQ